MKNIRQQFRKTAIIGCFAICLLGSVRSFFFAVITNQGVIQNLIVGVLLLGLSFAIYRQYRWALRLTAGICLITAVFLPIGLFNPFTAGDYMVTGKSPPTILQTLLWLIPLEILFMAIAFIIDPKKERT
jgi:hypothetical protein